MVNKITENIVLLSSLVLDELMSLETSSFVDILPKYDLLGSCRGFVFIVYDANKNIYNVIKYYMKNKYYFNYHMENKKLIIVLKLHDEEEIEFLENTKQYGLSCHYDKSDFKKVLILWRDYLGNKVFDDILTKCHFG